MALEALKISKTEAVKKSSEVEAAEREEYEERAAIMEFDGGLSRVEAERQAFERILARRGIGSDE